MGHCGVGMEYPWNRRGGDAKGTSRGKVLVAESIARACSRALSASSELHRGSH